MVASEAVVDIGVLARVAAQSWVAYDLNGSSLWVGAVAAYIGNRVNHRILVATIRTFIGILAVNQAILIGTGTMRTWHQAVLTLITGLALAFAWPSFVTFLNDIVMGLIPIGWTISGAIAHLTTNETDLITSAIASITIIGYIASPGFRRG